MTERQAQFWATSVVLIYLMILLSACSTAPVVEERVISVPSSAPYRFIKWSRDDTPESIAAMQRHNRTHQAVIDAEKKSPR